MKPKTNEIKTGYKIFYAVMAGLFVMGQIGEQLELMTILWIIPWIVVAYACFKGDAGLAYGWNMVNILWCAVLMVAAAMIGEEYWGFGFMGLIFMFPVGFAQAHFIELKAKEAT